MNHRILHADSCQHPVMPTLPHALVQALGIADWLDRARGRHSSSTGSRKQKQRRAAPRLPAQAAGDAALQRSIAAAAAEAQPEAPPPPDDGTSGEHLARKQHGHLAFWTKIRLADAMSGAS
jgi:hypothetical protein